MIENYEIVKKKNEEILILHFNYNYEFSKLKNKKEESIIERIKNFIKENKIKFSGKTIALATCGIIVCTLYLNVTTPNDYEKLDTAINKQVTTLKIDNQIFNLEKGKKIREEIAPKKITNVKKSNTQNKITSIKKSKPQAIKKTNNTTKKVTKTNTTQKTSTTKKANSTETKVKVYRSNGSIITLSLEEYVIGVVGAEMPASFNQEALKAQAVVARTYAMNAISSGKKLTDTVTTQSYKDNNQLKRQWGKSYNTYYNKIKKAVNSTKGICLTYNGKYIYAVYHSTSNGKTEDAKNVWGKSYPYLKSVSSTWDKNVSSYQKTITKEFNNINKILGLNINESTKININKNKSGRVSTINIGNKKYTGTTFRNLLGLRSADFDISIKNNQVKITTRGYGHGVGMSQYGANEMAKSGKTYKQILNHYYTNVKYKTIK